MHEKISERTRLLGKPPMPSTLQERRGDQGTRRTCHEERVPASPDPYVLRAHMQSWPSPRSTQGISPSNSSGSRCFSIIRSPSLVRFRLYSSLQGLRDGSCRSWPALPQRVLSVAISISFRPSVRPELATFSLSLLDPKRFWNRDAFSVASAFRPHSLSRPPVRLFGRTLLIFTARVFTARVARGD